MSTIVQRAPADKSGGSIISSVLTTIAARKERGQYEVNEQMDDRVILEGSVMDLEYYQPGLVCRVDNKGTVKNGLVTKCGGTIKISETSIDARSTVTVETIK